MPFLLFFLWPRRRVREPYGSRSSTLLPQAATPRVCASRRSVPFQVGFTRAQQADPLLALSLFEVSPISLGHVLPRVLLSWAFGLVPTGKPAKTLHALQSVKEPLGVSDS